MIASCVDLLDLASGRLGGSVVVAEEQRTIIRLRLAKLVETEQVTTT